MHASGRSAGVIAAPSAFPVFKNIELMHFGDDQQF